MRDASVLFLGKRDDPHCERAAALCRSSFREVVVHLGAWGDPLPAGLDGWRGDHVISYLSRWVVPGWLLERARVAINFHPGPPEYPGIGCNNFALYEEAREYGVTCHHMAPRVDTGAIIEVRRFPVLPGDDVASLLARTYEHLLALFHEVLGALVAGVDLPASAETWTRPPLRRREFERLFVITTDMDADEVRRRVRALTYGPYRPYVELHGFRFELR